MVRHCIFGAWFFGIIAFITYTTIEFAVFSDAIYVVVDGVAMVVDG